MSEAPPRLLQGSPRWGRVCQSDGGHRREEDLRGPESRRRNTSLKDTNCTHHVGSERRVRPSALLTAVTRPRGRAPPRPHPFLPACNQSGVRPRRCSAFARCPQLRERTNLSAHDPAAPSELSGLSPAWVLPLDRVLLIQAWSSLLGMCRWKSWRPGQIIQNAIQTVPLTSHSPPLISTHT